VANALVCKTSIHGFKSHSVLQNHSDWYGDDWHLAKWGEPVLAKWGEPA
jgi:hypothetical protein